MANPHGSILFSMLWKCLWIGWENFHNGLECIHSLPNVKPQWIELWITVETHISVKKHLNWFTTAFSMVVPACQYIRQGSCSLASLYRWLRQAAASISQTARQGTCSCVLNDCTTSDTCTLHTQLADGYTWLVWNSFTTEKLIYSCKGFSGFSNSPQSAHVQYQQSV